MTRKYPIKIKRSVFDRETLARMGFATMADFRADSERGRMNTARFFATPSGKASGPRWKLADHDPKFKRNMFAWKLLRSC